MNLEGPFLQADNYFAARKRLVKIYLSETTSQGNRHVLFTRSGV